MTTFELLPGSSLVEIEARSSVHPIGVATTRIAGHVDVEVDGDVNGLRGGRLEVELADLRSGNPLVDRETRRRIDLRRHPRLIGELTAAHPSGVDGRFDCHGEIRFHGRTQPVSGRLHVRMLDPGGLALEGEQTFDVRRWGLQPPRMLLLKVEPEVRVRIRLVARAAA